MKIKNLIEMKLLGYTVFSDRENYITMFKRLLDHFIIHPLKKILKFERCSYCEKLTRDFEKVVVDYEPDEDGGHRVWGYACQNCIWHFEG